MKQTLHSGDLCVIEGYGNRVWEVIGYTFEKSYMEGDFYEEIIYNLACVMTSEWTIGIQEDVQLVCRAKYAIHYIRQLNGQGLPPSPESNGYVSAKQQKGAMVVKDMFKSKEGKEPFIYPNTRDGLLMELSDLLCKQEELTRLGIENSELEVDINEVKDRLSNMKS